MERCIGTIAGCQSDILTDLCWSVGSRLASSRYAIWSKSKFPVGLRHWEYFDVRLPRAPVEVPATGLARIAGTRFVQLLSLHRYSLQRLRHLQHTRSRE